jgi:hypothetical protein
MFPSLVIDLEGCRIEKETEVMITLENMKKTFSIKFAKPEIKDEWMDLIRAVTK